MSVLTRKIGTLRHAVRDRGMAGMMAILNEKVPPVTRPALDYARLAPSAVSSLARHGRPDMLINTVGGGIGDDLLCTAMFRELRRRDQQNFWVMSKHPELFRGNADVSVVVPFLARYDILLKQLGAAVVYPWYTSYNPAYDRDDPIPEQHLISIMCAKAGLTGPITLKPYLSLSEDELERGKLLPRQVGIQSSGLNAKHAMRNKNWFLENYQGVVSLLKDRYDFVQVGSITDAPLEGALDLRGKTTLRETAAVLAGSLAFVGQVGFLMHLARAVDCRSVIVYGGREAPGQSGYPCNANLYSAVSCSPCWRLNTCPYDRMCLQMIGVADVADALVVQVEQYGSPLACDTVTITREQVERDAARYEQAEQAHRFAWSVLFP